VRARAKELDPWVWVDLLTDRTAPAIDLDALREGSDLAADIVRIADGILASPEAAAREIEAVFGPLASKLGHAGIEMDPTQAAAALVERARDRVLDLVLEKEGQ
jgi:hypothetical protein